MRARVILFLMVFAAAATAQVELVSDNYFPADLEFQELQEITTEKTFDDAARLPEIDNGRWFLDVGFESYSQRTYATGNQGSLSIEVVKLKDWRAAFSLLTLLPGLIIQEGPPGEAFAIRPGRLQFAHDRYWVDIRGNGVAEDLPMRVAVSISNRIGPRQNTPPALISHFPQSGYDESSLKYIIGAESFQSFASSVAGGQLEFNPAMEIAQAAYSWDGHEGILTLVGFPTSQMAEDHFSELADWETAEKNIYRTYARKVGPLLGFLEGTYDPAAADKLMSSIQYAYSVRWIYEKGKNTTTVWGVPVSILGTVVRSLLFVALLCAASVFMGICIAGIRFWMRWHASKNPLNRADESENTFLKIP